MHRLIPSLLAVAVSSLLAVAPAQALADDALERLLDDGALERSVASALAGIDLDALLLGFTSAAQAAADGQPVDRAQTDLWRAQIDQQMAASGPQLAQAAAGILVPALQQLRTELGRELAAIERD